MKAWVYLIGQGLVTNKDEILLKAAKEPKRTRAYILYLLKESNLTVENVKQRFFFKSDFAGQEVNTWEQLFDVEIYRFTPKVIKGNNKVNNNQLELPHYTPFKLRVIKNGG